MKMNKKIERFEDLYILCGSILWSGKLNTQRLLVAEGSEDELDTVNNTVDWDARHNNNMDIILRAADILIHSFNMRMSGINYCDEIICHPFIKDGKWGLRLTALVRKNELEKMEAKKN